MSDTGKHPAYAVGRAPAGRILGWLIAAILGFVAPLFLPGYWLDLGAMVFATAVGSIGLMLLFGRVGQLSLGHPFFLAIGAYGYVWFSSPSGADEPGLGLPSVVGILLAACLAGLAGLLLSPISARLKGLSLGLATLSLVFIGQWLLYTMETLTGGYNGRATPPLVIGPLSSTGSTVALFGVPIGGSQFLWYVTLVVLVLVIAFTTALLRGRTGRAFAAVREVEVHASALGVHVARYRAIAFALSSLYAGLCGALLAVLLSFVVPEYWGLMLAMSYLAMVVIGGLRSVAGAVCGAAFVAALPALLQRYGSSIPGLAESGGSGITPAVAAELVYAVVLIAVLVLEPEGLVALARRLTRSDHRSRRGTQSRPTGSAADTKSPSPTSGEGASDRATSAAASAADGDASTASRAQAPSEVSS